MNRPSHASDEGLGLAGQPAADGTFSRIPQPNLEVLDAGDSSTGTLSRAQAPGLAPTGGSCVRPTGGAVFAPQARHVPRAIVVAWALAGAIGASAVGLAAAEPSSTSAGSTGLSPDTVGRYLAAAAGPNARDVRVNGVYGSGHSGAWQFVAHISWHTPTGTLTSAALDIPQDAGATTPDYTLTGSRLADEQRIGWTPDHLQRALARNPQFEGAPLALLELQTADTGSTLTTCAAPMIEAAADDPFTEAGNAATSPAGCRTVAGTGAVDDFADRVEDSPEGGPLAVQRLGHLITP